MEIEEAFYNHVTGLPAISSLIDDRLYPATLPQNPVYPAATYRAVSSRTPMAHDGPIGLTVVRLQVDCYGTSKLQATQVARALRRALNGAQGTWDSVEVEHVFFLNENDDFGDAAEVNRAAIDFEIQYKE